MIPAISLSAPRPSSFSRRATISTRPLSLAGISSTLKPHCTAVAGFVPCALSGTKTRRLWDAPSASSRARIAIIPQSSPCAPALGVRATAGILQSVMSQSDNSYISSNAPCTVETGCRGCTSAKPGKRETFSLSRGLCFIVQDPSG